MTSCCSDRGGACSSDNVQQRDCEAANNKQNDREESDIGCCVDSACKCNDTCFDELARAICADDDTCLHGRIEGLTTSTPVSECASGIDGNASDCACCPKDESNTVNTAQDTCVYAPSPAGAGGCEDSVLRKRSVPKSSGSPSESHNPEQACGEHRSIARSRYNDTLAAFGCVCKALLARGRKSCCNSTGVRGKGVPRSESKTSLGFIISERTSHESSRPESAKSCCSKSDCGVQTASGSAMPYRGHRASQSIKSRSCDSVDSCCRGGDCCDGNSKEDDVSVHDEKSEHIAIDIVEKPSTGYAEHAVLAIKGMTCVGCENKLIRTLRDIPGIRNIKTSLVLCRAEFDVDNGAPELESLVALVEKRSGFSAELIKAGSTRKLPLAVSGPLQEKFMTAVRPLGVEAVVRSDKDNVLVIYNPRIIGGRKILESYEEFSPVLAPEPPDPAIMAGVKHIRTLALRAVSSAVLTIPVLVMTWAPLPPHHRAYSIASLVLATIVQTAITGPFYVSSFKGLVFSHVMEIELLIVLSTTAAYVYSVAAFAYDMLGHPLATGEFFETSTLLVTLIMVGQLISAVARQRAIEAISIRSLQERTACIVLPDGTEQELDVRLMHYGDTFKVLPDSTIITDGTVSSGTSSVDESMMTGESRPVEKSIGSTVIAGTLNGSSTLFVEATRLPGENTISDIAGMVDNARLSRARVQETVDWVCGWFVPVVLVLAIITFVIWLAVGIAVRHQPKGEAAVTALTYAISVLAISCPCAIGLAVPMVILIAGGVGAKLGLVFKAATTIEQARKVNHVVLDKTGTVTQGKLSVVSRFLADDAGFDVATAVAQLVATSRHPVARAVAADLTTTTIDQQVVEEVEMVTGKGVQGSLLGKLFRGGSAKWVGFESHSAVQPLLAQGLTVFCVTHGMRLVAAFGLADTLRPEAQAVLQSLTARNIRVSILSGDHPSAVFATAASLGIPADRARAGCLPADKQAYIKELTEQGDTVLFCGDGTNDAVALAQADVGVHLHTGEGAGVAASTAADVVLTHPSLTGLLTLLELSDAVARRIMLNFAWSFVYNLVAILFAAGAFVHARISPAYAGLGEVVSVLPVVVVALQLKWFKPSV